MIKFYFLIAIEALFSPLLYLFEWLKRINGKFVGEAFTYKKENKPLERNVVFLIHEWAGYPFVRSKTIKYVNKKFVCGLKFHLERLAHYNGKYILDKVLTLSDYNTDYTNKLKQLPEFTDDIKIFPVDNTAMDFSGYSYLAAHLIDMNREQIIFLTNTSVAQSSEPFIDEYISFFEKDPSLGLLGISYSTKIYQSLIKNNFRPHLQSFFLITKTSVLKQVIKRNGGMFPGGNESYKLGIIRFGEVKITELVQKLGYKCALLTEQGGLTVLPRFGFFYNGFSKWKLPFGDYRLHCKEPNKITKIMK